MKKTITLFLILIMICFFSTACADLDLSGMGLDELIKLKQEVDDAIFKKDGAVIIQAGDYLVGKDIAVGSYVISFYENDRNLSYGKIFVYNSLDAMRQYKTDFNDYQVQIGILDSNSRNGIEIKMSDKPAAFDYGKYLTTNIDEYIRAGSTYHIILEEDQVLHIEMNVGELIPVIQQAKGLFMN